MTAPSSIRNSRPGSRARRSRPSRSPRRASGGSRRENGRAERLHHRPRGRGARRRQTGRRRDRGRTVPRPAARRADLAEGPHRPRGRRRPRPRRACSTATSRGRGRARSPPACARPAPSSSASATCTSSRSARRARTRRSARCAIRWDPTRSPGGSSGGSAAAVVTGMGVRVGRHRHRRLDPDSRGRLRLRRPEADLRRTAVRRRRAARAASLDHVGPIARTVADAWLLYHAMAGDRNPPLLPTGARPGALAAARPARPYFMDVLDADGRGARSTARSNDCATPGVGDLGARHAATRPTSPPSTCTCSSPRRPPTTRATLEAHPDRYTAPVQAAARDGAIRAGRGLRPGARRRRGAAARGGRGARRTSTRWCCPTRADHGAADRQHVARASAVGPSRSAR